MNLASGHRHQKCSSDCRNKEFGGVEQQSDTTVEGSFQNEESVESSIVNCVKVTTAKPANRAARLEIAFNCSVFSSTSLRFFSTNLNLQHR
jgi:hypothetical protein